MCRSICVINGKLNSRMQLLVWCCCSKSQAQCAATVNKFSYLPLSLSCPCTTPATQRDLNWTFRGQGWIPSEQPSSGCHKKGTQNPAQRGKCQLMKRLGGIPPQCSYNNRDLGLQSSHQPACGKHPQVELISTCLSSFGIGFLFAASAPPQPLLSTACCITEEDSEWCQLQSAEQRHLEG